MNENLCKTPIMSAEVIRSITPSGAESTKLWCDFTINRIDNGAVFDQELVDKLTEIIKTHSVDYVKKILDEAEKKTEKDESVMRLRMELEYFEKRIQRLKNELRSMEGIKVEN